MLILPKLVNINQLNIYLLAQKNLEWRQYFADVINSFTRDVINFTWRKVKICPLDKNLYFVNGKWYMAGLPLIL